MNNWISGNIRRKLFVIVCLCFIYFLSARLGLQLTFQNTNSCPIWPPTGIAIAAVFLFGSEIWPGIFIGAFAANYITFFALHHSLPICVVGSAFTALGNTLEGVLTVFLIRKFSRGQNPFEYLNDTILFIFFGSFLCPLISAAIGTVTFSILSPPMNEPLMMGFVWWTGDAIGALTVVPIILNWKKFRDMRWTPVKAVEFSGFLICLAVYYLIVFHEDMYFEYFVILLLIWSALRFNIFFTSMNMLLITVLSDFGTIHRHGPFIRNSVVHSLAMLQIYTGMIAVSILILEVVLHEKESAVEALQFSKERFRILIESSPIAIAVTRSNLITYANSKFLDIFAPFVKTSLAGFNMLERIQHEDTSKFLTAVQNVQKETASETTFETKAIRLDGSIFPASITTSTVELGDGISEVVFVQDITQQKWVEASWRESQQMLQLVLDTIPVGVHWKNVKSVYIGCNKLCATDAELNSPVEIIGKTDYDLPWKQFAPLYQQRDTEVIETAAPLLNYEQPRSSSDGKIFLLRQNKLPLYDTTGRIIGVLTTYEDITESKKTAEALVQSEQKYRQLVENSNSIITRWNIDGEITFMNDFGLSFFGYRAEEIVGKNVLDTIVPAFDSKGNSLSELMQNICREPLQYGHVINENCRKDGSRIWVEWHNKVYSDSGSDFQEIFSVGLDVTERKKTEDALSESERRLSTLVGNLPGVAYRCHPDTHHTMEYMSQGVFALTGYHRDDFINNKVISFQDIITSEFKDILRDVWEEIIALHTIFRAEYEIITKTGEHKWVWEQGCGIYSAEDELVAIEGFITDITERRRATDALQQSETQYRTLFESAQDAIFIIKNHTYIDCNSAALRMFSGARRDFVGSSIFKLSPEIQPDGSTSIEKLKEVFEAALKGSPQFFEWRYNRLDGSEFDAEVYLNAIDIPRQKLTIALIRDITERKRSEEHIRQLLSELQSNAVLLEKRVAERTEELAVAKERAESADKLKSAFLATMSHELRTPLNSIIGFTGIILRGLAGPLNEEQSKQLRMANNSAQHLLALINDVLDISKIEAKQLEVVFKEFDFNQSLNMVLVSLKPLAEKKHILLASTISADITTIESDKRRVEQIFLNLINNAIKFTDQGSVSVYADKLDDRLKVDIIDTGIGIHEDNLEHIFEPFRQVDSGLSRMHEGTGLGLSICKALLTKLGGQITIRSALGTGTTVTVYLPIKHGE